MLVSYQGPPLRSNVSPDEIEAAKTPKGGWTKATLAAWGVPWPPPPGWKDELIRCRQASRP
ncbi:hypothetical protein Ate01nite_49590 [Actinoplanes teichomyceticus]|nr:hypothetical protein Ate01nite_49590 [Actinoplanes teichomyceticus]